MRRTFAAMLHAFPFFLLSSPLLPPGWPRFFRGIFFSLFFFFQTSSLVPSTSIPIFIFNLSSVWTTLFFLFVKIPSFPPLSLSFFPSFLWRRGGIINYRLTKRKFYGTIKAIWFWKQRWRETRIALSVTSMLADVTHGHTLYNRAAFQTFHGYVETSKC